MGRRVRNQAELCLISSTKTVVSMTSCMFEKDRQNTVRVCQPAFESNPEILELKLEFYLIDRQLHTIGKIISKGEIILSGDSHKGTDWALT